MKKTDVLLDLLPDVEPEREIEVAHDSEEKEEKEEIEQGAIKVKRSRKTSEEDEDGTNSKFWEYVKYGAIAGFAVLIVELIIARHRRKKSSKGPDMQEMMMLMMYQTMMIQMQNIQNQQQHKESLPPQIVTNDDTKFSTDWSKWFEENGGKEIKNFGSSKSSVLNQMHVAENWKVRRDLNGKILDVSKTNEYIR